MLAGAIPTGILAVLVDFLLGRLTVLVRSARRHRHALNGIISRQKQGGDNDQTNSSWDCVAGLGALGARRRTRRRRPIVVGGKNFTEQQIMAEMTSQLLKAKGFTPDKRTGMGSAVLRQAQESGQIDVYWEYTGTSLITYNKITDQLDRRRRPTSKVKELDGAKGLVWLDPSKANNTYALAMSKDGIAKTGIKTLSDFAAEGEGRQGLTFAVQRRVLRPARRACRPLEKDVRLRVAARQRQADGHRPRLSGAARQAGRRRPRVRDRRARRRPSTSSS